MSSNLLANEGDVGWAAKTNNAISAPSINGFRLTLSAGTPVTTADVTGAGTIYLSPYTSDRISLFDGANWQEYSSSDSEISQALSTAGSSGGTLVSGTNYDVFVYDKAGTITIETPLTAWSGSTSRATSIVRKNGVWVKATDNTRRLVGTIRTTSTTTTEDSSANRYVDNVDNQVLRVSAQIDTTTSWTYQSTTWRGADAGASAWKFNFVNAVDGKSYFATMILGITCNSSTTGCIGIGYDTTTAPVNSSAPLGLSTVSDQQVSGFRLDPVVFASGFSTLGLHFLQGLEVCSNTTAPVTFSGQQTNSPPLKLQSGMTVLSMR